MPRGLNFTPATRWDINDSVLFYQSGLDPKMPHYVHVENIARDDNHTLAVSSFSVFTPSSSVRGHGTNVAAIVGPVIAGVVVTFTCVLLFAHRRRKFRRRKQERVETPIPLEPYPRNRRASIWHKGGDVGGYVTMLDSVAPHQGKRALIEGRSPFEPLGSSSGGASSTRQGSSTDPQLTASPSTYPRNTTSPGDSEPIVEITVPAVVDTREIADLVAQRLEEQRPQLDGGARENSDVPPPRYHP